MITASTPLDKSAMLIINPVSGKKLVLRYIPDIIRRLMDAGYMVSTFITSRRGEATEFVQSYGAGQQLICCTGGDGTLNEVLTGLARDIPTAAARIAGGKSQRYDIGRFGEHFFSYVAAFGAFSWLSYTTDQKMKNALGHTAYILDAIKDVYKIKPEHVRMTANGVTYEGDYIFGAVSNSTSVAGTIELPADIVDTADGLFEVILVKMPETIFDLNSIVTAILNQDYTNPFITFFQAATIDIDNAPDLYWALDGECSGGYEHIHIEPMRSFLDLQGAE